MYDISNLNTISDLQDMLASVDHMLKQKDTDREVKRLCADTKKALLEKIAAIKKRDGV